MTKERRTNVYLSGKKLSEDTEEQCYYHFEVEAIISLKKILCFSLLDSKDDEYGVKSEQMKHLMFNIVFLIVQILSQSKLH